MRPTSQKSFLNLSEAVAPDTTEEASTERLKALEMRLDTVTIKINETEENRRNYELNIAHLKEEEFERYFQLEALRSQLAQIDDTWVKMNADRVSALAKKEKAEVCV